MVVQRLFSFYIKSEKMDGPFAFPLLFRFPFFFLKERKKVKKKKRDKGCPTSQDPKERGVLPSPLSLRSLAAPFPAKQPSTFYKLSSFSSLLLLSFFLSFRKKRKEKRREYRKERKSKSISPTKPGLVRSNSFSFAFLSSFSSLLLLYFFLSFRKKKERKKEESIERRKL